MRPSVRGAVLDADNRLLAFRRIVPDREIYYSIPGGHIEPGDATLEDTLHRELLEELGATVTSVIHLESFTYPWKGELKTQRIQDAMVDVCENLKDRFAVLDCPRTRSVEVVKRWRRRVDSSYAAFYWPWIGVPGR